MRLRRSICRAWLIGGLELVVVGDLYLVEMVLRCESCFRCCCLLTGILVCGGLG